MNDVAARMIASGRTSSNRTPFFPRADAAVLFSKHAQPPIRPRTVGPVYDPGNADVPVVPYSRDVHEALYPPPAEPFTASTVPDRPPMCASDKYLRAHMASNERLRLSMLWYYTRDILNEGELLSGLQEKVHMAKESTEWEFAIIGILDVNYYIRLATIGVPLGILPRGETICAHTVTQPPNSVFLLPNLMEDWRFQKSPYVESGGLRAYAGAPLRVQNESGEVVALGSLCVASPYGQAPLTKTQQQTITHLADWVVSDIVQCARARRQRERRWMTELLSVAQKQTDEDAECEEPVFRILRTVYPDSSVCLRTTRGTHLEVEGREPIDLCELDDGVWEDTDYIDDFVLHSNHRELPDDRVVRVIAAPCESISGPSLLAVASKDFRLVFDDVDLWFIQTCATMISQMWHKRLLAEVMRAKEKFLRGVSHQLRTPIHGILGSVELLAEELKSKKAMIEAATSVMASAGGGPSLYLDTIKTSGRDLISIVNSMITLNRWADIAMTERSYTTRTICELEADLAGDIQKAISGDIRYRASICFQHKLDSECDSICTDQSLLRDSILPLLLNAVQNTPKGTVKVTISLCSDAQELIIDIEDNGCGIDPKDQVRIFEPYEKVIDHSTGAGLGLTLASKFATLLNGVVQLVSSKIDGGSHFRATFREVERVRSDPEVKPFQATQLTTLPTSFHRMALDSGPLSLCEYFTGCLLDRGFTESVDTVEGSFTLVDFVSDALERRKYLSQVPSDTLAICLIPASEAETPLEPIPDNVVYVNGPLFTATIDSALREADKHFALIAASKERIHPDEGLSSQSNLGHPKAAINDDLSPDSNASSSEGPTASSLRDRELQRRDGTSADMTVSAKPEVGVVPVEPRIIVPVMYTFASAAKPMALIVDDNLINLRIMQMYCRKRGLPFVYATDGSQAVETFLNCQMTATAGPKGGNVPPAAIQLILMDLQMPVCDGIEATRRIRELEKRYGWPRSALFIVTGQDNLSDRSAADNVGADEFFVKPVGVKVLDRGVKRYFPAFETG